LTGLRGVGLAEGAALLRRLASLFIALWLVACATRSGPGAVADDDAADCSLRVIASFAPTAVPNPPDATFLQELARDTGVQLTYVRSLTSALHVLMLSADDADDPDCQRALARLRSDTRVRSADVDERRQPQR
jgi:hypothetical protein